MFCPNCGIESEPNRKFCRSCGLSLETISQVLAGQAPVIQPAGEPLTPQQPVDGDRQKMKRWGFIIMMGGLLLAALLGILGGAFSNLDSDLGGFIASLAGLGGVVFLAGIGTMIYSLLLPKTAFRFQPRNQTALPPVQQPLNIQSDYGRMPASSVTENTTELLDTPHTAPKGVSE